MPRRALTGNEAMAEAMRQINPDVVAAYPITPATEIVQIFASFVSDGLVTTQFIPTESEHSAISACVGASAAGARVMTGTSSQGLALMHEVLYQAAGLRAPIVICEVNRSLSAPINIHCDHSDTMGSKEAGWIQIYAEDSQDAYDSVIQAIRIAETVFLPTMVSTDGFIISHCMQGVEILEDKQVQDFIGPHRSAYSLFGGAPITVGPLDLQDYYFEHRRQLMEAMNTSLTTLDAVNKEFKQKFGRGYDIIEEYKTEDADHIVMAMGSTCGTAKVAIDKMRAKGVKVGLIKLHVFRPFPHEQLKKALSKAKFVTVLDRSDTASSMGGPIFVETRAALYDQMPKILFADYIYGLGGRDIDIEEIATVIEKGEKMKLQGKVEKPLDYIGLRE
ncbi:MAG: pyruvate ferredoxin oxidoreductase [bacterium]|jgi:pyruvate ferredoxin oxidoreductase alpha subunit|nr:pyruvate ferredoxin oxidoreductase [bacterium]